jgi:hypothetical protein
MPTTIRDRSRGRIAWDGLHDVAVSSEKTEKMTTLLLKGVVL